MSERTKEVAIAIWLLFILALVILAAATGSAQNIEGQLIASQYGTWQVFGYAPDTYTGFAPTACRVQGGASFFDAFTVGTPIKIVDGNPALTETVTPTNVTINNNACAISIVPANHHNLPYYLTSATGGLQEALTANYANPAINTIILDNKFYVSVGASHVAGIISSVIGYSTLGLVDITQTPYVWYTWNGSQYVKAPSGEEVSSVFGRTGAVVAESGDYTCLEVTGCGAEPNAYLTTTLSTSISTTDTVIPLAASPSNLTTAGVVVIDSEWIAYSGISGNNLTGATRGYHQTTASSHSGGAGIFVVTADLTNPSHPPWDYVVSTSITPTLLVFGCATPDQTGQVSVQFGCAGTGLEINDSGNILQEYGVGENKFEAATGIGPGGGLAPITNSGYLFDSTRQNQSTVPQGFGAGLAGPVESVQPLTIAAPSVVNFAGTGSTTWSWECTGTDVDGNTYPGSVTTISNGPVIPGGIGFIVTCPFSAGAASETIWRTAGGPNQGALITTAGPAPTETPDAGGSVTPGTPPATNSSVPKQCVGGSEVSCWTSTATAPTGSCTNGWFDTNQSGSPATLYQCASGTWTVVPPVGSISTWTPFYNASTTLNVAEYYRFTPNSAITITRLQVGDVNPAAGCSTYPIVGIYDATAASWIATVTYASGEGYVDSGVISVAVTSGHILEAGVQTVAVGCSTSPSNLTFNVQYTTS